MKMYYCPGQIPSYFSMKSKNFGKYKRKALHGNFSGFLDDSSLFILSSDKLKYAVS